MENSELKLSFPHLSISSYVDSEHADVVNLISSIFTEHGLKSNDSFFSTITEEHYDGRHGVLWVVKDGEKVVGVGGVHIDPKNAQVAWLERLYIHQEYRGKGLGKLLVGKAFDFATSRKSMLLQLHTTDVFLNAVSLYTALGFEVTGRAGRKGTELIMTRKLE